MRGIGKRTYTQVCVSIILDYSFVHAPGNHTAAERVANEFAQSTLEVEDAQQSLLDMEETLHDNLGTLDRFRKDYSVRGNEKYRPDPKRTQCERASGRTNPSLNGFLSSSNPP